jgi:hypothetical protein
VKFIIYGKNGKKIDVVGLHIDMNDKDFMKKYSKDKDFNKIIYEAIKNLAIAKWGDFDSYEMITDINYIIMERRNYPDWYVLHYDTKTTAYLNEIEFMNFGNAMAKYNKELPYSSTDRVELMFSPMEDDDMFDENVLICSKLIKEE